MKREGYVISSHVIIVEIERKYMCRSPYKKAFCRRDYHEKMEKTVSILLSLTLIFSVFTISPFEVSAQGVVSCIERSWDGEKVVATEKTVSEYTVLDENTDTELSEGWYVVTQDVTFADRLMIDSGTVNLILCDYATLTDHAGIGVAEDAALNIYGQTENTGTILVHPQEETADPDNAAIGGTNDPAGDITVHGGTLDLKNDAGGCNGAGLGGGAYGAPSSVTIYAVPSRLNRSAARVSEAEMREMGEV